MLQTPTSQAAAPRYFRLDAYTEEELRCRYNVGSPADRLKLLDDFYTAMAEYEQLPLDIAMAAATASDVTVRQWFAKHARNVDYTGTDSAREAAPNLWKVLESDADIIVRAALHENPDYPRYHLFPRKDDLLSLSQIERLAVMRNPRLALNGVSDAVLAVFDPTDDTLAVTPAERTELAFAYLTNEEALKRSHDFDYPSEIFDSAWHFEQERKKLWELTAEFPDHHVQWFGLRYLGAKDPWKAAAYRKLGPVGEDESSWENYRRSSLRRAILQNCTEADVETLRLGVDDPDEGCNEFAGRKYFRVEKKSIVARVFGHVWVGVSNLLLLGVIGALLFSAESEFERIVIAALTLIFLALTSLGIGLSDAFLRTAAALDNEFYRLRKLQGEKLSADEFSAIAVGREEVRVALSKNRTNHVIIGVFHFLAWILAVLTIIGTLL